MAALRASRLVWSAIDSMTLTIEPISRDQPARRSMAAVDCSVLVGHYDQSTDTCW